MPQEILIALIGIGSALLGTLAGGVVTYFSNKSIKSIEWAHSVRREEIAEKKILYAEFLKELNRLMIKSRNEKTSDLTEFDQLAYCLARIQIFSNDGIIDVAKQLAKHALSCHAEKAEEESDYPALRKKFASEVKSELDDLIST